jgi:hypothetical protein
MSEKAKVHHGGLRAGGRKRTEKAKPDARTKFRGVSRQPSGRYGAQIRESKGKARTHTWLGTFDKAEDAARAFDAAAVARCGPAAITNFQQPVAVDVSSTTLLCIACHVLIVYLLCRLCFHQGSGLGGADCSCNSPADVASWPWSPFGLKNDVRATPDVAAILPTTSFDLNN